MSRETDFSSLEKWVVRLSTPFPWLLRKQRAAGSSLAQTQLWQLPLPPVEMLEITRNGILPVTGALVVVDLGSHLVTLQHPLSYRRPYGYGRGCGRGWTHNVGFPWLPAVPTAGCRYNLLVSLPGEEGISS